MTKKIPSSPIAIVGLGNPGDEFQHSPHNAGFDVIDMAAEKLDAEWKKEKDAYIAHANVGSKKIILVKPLSFMNKSGTVVARVQKFYHVPAQNIWVIHDDVDIPLGAIKLVQNRSAAGHKGVESIIKNLKTQDFPRFRVGIKSPRMPKSRSREQMVQIVTKPFTGENRKKFQEGLRRCMDALMLALEKDIPQAMNEANKK